MTSPESTSPIPRVGGPAGAATRRARRVPNNEAQTGRPRGHIGCISSKRPMISTRIAIRETTLYAGDLSISDDCSQCLMFPDKEEVPGSSPGSPTPRSAGG